MGIQNQMEKKKEVILMKKKKIVKLWNFGISDTMS